MGTRYYPVKMYGVYLGEDDIVKFLAKHGYHVDEERYEEAGWEVISDIPGLEEFAVSSDNAGGYTCYLGVFCDKAEEGKTVFENAFPKVTDAKFHEFNEAL
jgi:hypothetical protein